MGLPDRRRTGRVPDDVVIVVRDRRAEPVAGPLQRLLRQRLPDPAGRDAVLAQPLAAGAEGRRPAGRRLGLGRVAARHPDARRSGGRWPASSGGGPTGALRTAFDAVEYDNLDSFSRSHRLITRGDTRWLRAATRRPRPRRRAAGGAEELRRVGRLHGRLRLRGRRGVRPVARVRRYEASYGGLVLAIEYARRPFRRACRGWGDRISVVRRDLAVSDDGIRRWCAS